MVWISAEAMPITAFYGEKEKGQNKSVREVKGADGCRFYFSSILMSYQYPLTLIVIVRILIKSQ
ncbi:MAG: hypothetical protein ACJ8BW_39550 [Ktedonobacteraceae bacterium]|jgi:hypothetical protein